ncbi:MAG: M56 family metallopeptidase [Ruminococcaceae bacterium]|nr:M56 family metallopeptidase [Oscillospiraceae bacterium]
MDIFQMSLSASVLIVVVVMIRALALHKLPKKTFLVLWGIVICRLLVPFSIPSRFSFYAGLDVVKHTFEGSAAVSPLAGTAEISNILNISGTEQSIGVCASAVSVSPIEIIWLSGLCVCALFFIVAYIKCLREFKMSLPVENNFSVRWLREHALRRFVQIRQSDRIKAPLTYGIFQPVVLFPKETDWTDETKLLYILTHEFTHIRRFDTLTKLVLAVAVCVHWFNPFVWMMYVLANRDIELSCDETVVRTFGETMKSAYASMLVCMEETKSGLTPLVNHFSKNAIEERIVSIMKMKKATIFSIILALVVVAGTATAFATQAAALDGDNAGLSISAGLASAEAKPLGEKETELPPYTFDNGKSEENYPEYFTLNSEHGYYTYNGKMVAVFYDDNVWNGENYSGMSCRYEPDYTGEVVYAKTARDPKTNKVIGIKEMTKAEVEKIAASSPNADELRYN